MIAEVRKPWFDGLQALKGLLILLVFVSHSGAFFHVSGGYGAMAVSVFFVLSGFLSAVRNADEERPSVFRECFVSLWRKVKRFWPVYAAMLPFAYALNPCSGADFLKCLLLVQSYFGNAESALCLNWPTWFLSSILLCYLLSPAIVRVARRLGRCSAVLVLLLWVTELLWAVYWRGTRAATADPGYYWLYICPLARLLDFAIGVFVGVVYSLRATGCSRNVHKPVLCECAVVGAVLLSLLCHERVPSHFIASSFWLPFSVALIWVFANREGSFTKACNMKWLMWLGHRSFELYIVHRMVLLFAAKYSPMMPNFPSWLIALFLTCMLSEFIANAGAAVRAWASKESA